jgi:hypothetical protein
MLYFYFFFELKSLNDSNSDLKIEMHSETTLETYSCTFEKSVSSLNATRIKLSRACGCGFLNPQNDTIPSGLS